MYGENEGNNMNVYDKNKENSINVYSRNEEDNINEKGQKIPFSHTHVDAGDDDFERETLDILTEKKMKSTSEKIKRIVEWDNIVNLYRDASPSERINIENEINSLYGHATAVDIVNRLREETQKYDLANSIKDKIDNKLR